jgi:parvulin-like peptidyl-prolyl isomerase
MSLSRKLLVSLGALALMLAGGCAGDGPTRQDERAAYEEEMTKQRTQHQAQMAQVEQERDLIGDEATSRLREIERLGRELAAARLTSASHKESLDAALDLLARRNTELTSLKKGGGPKTAQEAVALLLAKDKQIKALRQEIARILAGDTKPQDKTLDGIVTTASLALDVPVGRIDGEPITRRNFIEFLYRDLGAPQLLDLYMNRYLVVREARRRKIEIAPVDLELWVTQQILLHTKQAGGEEKLTEELATKGFSREAWEARLRYQAEPTLMLKRMVELNRRTPEGKEAFARRVRGAYDELHTSRVIARHVLVACHENASPSTVRAALRKADGAYRQLKSGVKFEKIARHYSDDKQSRRKGGHLGTFDRKTYEILPRLNTAFFTLPVGEVSRPVRSRAGFHLVLVDKHLPPTKSFDEPTRRSLITRLEQEPPAREEVDLLVSKLRSRARIETALVFD